MITVCHHSASLVMPIGDHPDGIFYPILTLMREPYNMKLYKCTMYYRMLISDMCFKMRLPTKKYGLGISKHNHRQSLSHQIGGNRKRPYNSLNADQKSLETVLSIAIFVANRATNGKRKLCFLTTCTFDQRSSIVLPFSIAAYPVRL